MKEPRVAIVHDYLNQRGGAEKVVGVLHRMFPEAPIFTSIVDRDTLWPELRDARIVASWAQRLPFVLKHFKAYAPVYPYVFDRLDLSGYDLVLSSSSAFAKGVRARPGALHVCYCHGPTRFLWDRDRYLEGEGLPAAVRALMSPALARLARWDLEAARRPDVLVVNSTSVARRVERIYGRSSCVVPPPVDTQRFHADAPGGEYDLVVSRLVGYKRIDLAIEACRRLGRPLLIAGDGPARPRLEKLAGPSVRFLGRVAEEDLPGLYAGCRRLLVAAEEDFGIALVEANAAGRPIVAYGRGGALDIIREGLNGVLFDRQDAEAMTEALLASEAIAWDRQAIRRCADDFSLASFETRFRAVIDSSLREGVRGDRAPIRAATAEAGC